MFKKYIKRIFYVNLTLIILYFLFKRYNMWNLFELYIMNEFNYKFNDLLSMVITIVSIFVGFVVTIATVLVSMCDKRVIVLIKAFNKVGTLIMTIKVAIISGLVVIFSNAVMFTGADFSNIYIRITLICISINSLYLFIKDTGTLVIIVKTLLYKSFYPEDDGIVVNGKFKNNNKQK